MRISALGAPCFFTAPLAVVLVQEVASCRVVGAATAAISN